MRALMIATGLYLAATTVSAEPVFATTSRISAQMTLSNGCVYTPNPSGRANSWSLVYTRAGTSARCASTVRTQAEPVSNVSEQPVPQATTSQVATRQVTTQQVSRAQPAPVTYRQTALSLSEPNYIVGAFR